jgi:IS5 family transposase
MSRRRLDSKDRAVKSIDQQIISLKHPLVRLAQRIDWEVMNQLFGEYYEETAVGQPPKPTRLVAGLLYLKHTFALSDEALIARWVENAYWQYFCGETYFKHEPPIHPTSLTRYRQRLGQDGCEELLHLTIEAWLAERVIDQRDLAEVLVDTTVMEKGSPIRRLTPCRAIPMMAVPWRGHWRTLG